MAEIIDYVPKDKKAISKTYRIEAMIDDTGAVTEHTVTGFLKFGNLFVVVTDTADDAGTVLFAVATGLFRTASTDEVSLEEAA